MLSTGLIIETARSRDTLERVGREIYYAISQLTWNDPAVANLNQALKYLGIDSPRDVGLSQHMLKRHRDMERIFKDHKK